MISDPVQVSLDPQHATVLASLAQQTGKSYEQLVADAIEAAFTTQGHLMGEQLSAEARHENLRALLERMSQLPVCHPRDGLTGRDHDQILYGREKS